MKTEILMLLAAAVWTLAIVLPSGGSRSERQAEQKQCSRLAAHVKQGDASFGRISDDQMRCQALTRLEQAQ